MRRKKRIDLSQRGREEKYIEIGNRTIVLNVDCPWVTDRGGLKRGHEKSCERGGAERAIKRGRYFENRDAAKDDLTRGKDVH